jgi:hypothetical protein
MMFRWLLTLSLALVVISADGLNAAESPESPSAANESKRTKMLAYSRKIDALIEERNRPSREEDEDDQAVDLSRVAAVARPGDVWRRDVSPAGIPHCHRTHTKH